MGRGWVVLLLVAPAWGCASIDWDYPRTPSRAFSDTGDTRMGKAVAALPEAAEGRSGFYLVDDGVDALALRLMMAERAERSIDASYYLVKTDLTGGMFVDALLDAADRGVRVRVLTDDFLTSDQDHGMRGLHAHPNIEVRVFNPFARRSWRFLDALTDFGRVNRRMHNKSFTIDNQATIIGGRNIGDEYFAARKDLNFGDLDVFAVGPVVREVSELFDEYWNCERSLPAWAVTGAPEDPAVDLAELRVRVQEHLEESASSPYAAALSSTILDVATRGAQVLTWCPYELIHDSPDKAWASRAEDAESILTPMQAAIDGARDELLVVTPYLVLLDTGRAHVHAILDRGVRARVITNSLVANNHLMVHAGYVPTRRFLLEEGVDVYEARSDHEVAGRERVSFDSPRATLHTKAFLIDRERLFLGSFNFDPRSAYLNTEMGIILDDPALARRVADVIDRLLPQNTYEVTLDEDGDVRWTTWDGDEQVVYDNEPESTFWQRFKVCFLRMLPIEGQL